MNSVPDGPFFVAPLRSEQSGVDFLNLGAVGERLIAGGLPGITNVTRYLRPYTVAAWVVWQFNENLKSLSARGEKLPAHERTLFKSFREKAELMFSWYNRGVVGNIGNNRAYPDSSDPVMLSYANELFGPINRASWFAAAAYGPSFSEANGLGYIKAYKSIYVPTPLGERAARILDGLMTSRRTPHRRIANLLDHTASLRDVTELDEALNLGATTAKERTLFRDAFYPEARVGTWDMMHGNRATTIALILQTLALGGPLDVERIRQSIALGITPKVKAITDPRLQRMQRLWFALSLRQLERVAFERLLQWLEIQLFELLNKWCDVDVLCGELTETLEETWPIAAELAVGEGVAALRKDIEGAGGIWHAALNDKRLSQFAIRSDLEALQDVESRNIPSKAIYALLVCSAFVELCEDDVLLTEMLRMGARERVSLAALSQFVHSRANDTIAAFAKDVLVHLVYAQHLQTAAARVEEGKNKFRFAADDSGLRPLIPATSVNSQLGTPDRILHALYLMNECRLVRQDEESNYVVA